MILYFSGTGNSRYVAEKIASITGDGLVCINEKIRNSDFSTIDCGGRLVFVTPTHAWRIPRVVMDWISRTKFGSCSAWFVMTCGGEIGNAAKYNQLICENKHFTYMGTAQILMPENYIAMFDAPEQDEAAQIISDTGPDIQKAGELVKIGKSFPLPRNNLYDRAMSCVVNPVFYGLFVKADAFYAKDSCTACGKCASLCPLQNIHLADGKPVWGRNCCHCMACICHCPAEAIEYGRKSVGKPRYKCEK